MAKGAALITGASAGLGEHFAGMFARDGHDVLLVARSADKLQGLAKRLTEQHSIAAHVIPADLSEPDAPERVFAKAQELGAQVDYLVNNAGYGSTGGFLELPLQGEVAMLELNIVSLVKLTHLFGKPMVERKLGHILNIGSTAGFQPGPFMSTYYASKAFVNSWSQGLAYELRGTGVHVTCHCPGATATGFASRAGNDKSKLFQRTGVATAEAVAAHAYESMKKGKELVVHGAVNKISATASGLTPRRMLLGLVASLNRP